MELILSCTTAYSPYLNSSTCYSEGGDVIYQYHKNIKIWNSISFAYWCCSSSPSKNSWFMSRRSSDTEPDTQSIRTAMTAPCMQHRRRILVSLPIKARACTTLWENYCTTTTGLGYSQAWMSTDSLSFMWKAPMLTEPSKVSNLNWWVSSKIQLIWRLAILMIWIGLSLSGTLHLFQGIIVNNHFFFLYPNF